MFSYSFELVHFPCPKVCHTTSSLRVWSGWILSLFPLSLLPAEEESQLYPSGTFPDYDADTDLDSFLPDLSTMPSLNESLPPPNNDNGGGGDTSTFTGAIHFVTSHFRQESSDSEVDEAFVARLEAGRRHTRSRGSEASQSRPLSVGPAAPHSSRLSSQGSDIDIDEYELIDRSELPSSTWWALCAHRQSVSSLVLGGALNGMGPWFWD